MNYWRTYLWNESGDSVVSEQQILDFYWDHWFGKMLDLGKIDQITPENCIDDWAVVFWAWPDNIGWRKMKDEVA